MSNNLRTAHSFTYAYYYITLLPPLKLRGSSSILSLCLRRRKEGLGSGLVNMSAT